MDNADQTPTWADTIIQADKKYRASEVLAIQLAIIAGIAIIMIGIAAMVAWHPWNHHVPPAQPAPSSQTNDSGVPGYLLGLEG